MSTESAPYVLKMPISTSSSATTTTISKPSPKPEWLVMLPDHEGVLEKRMSVRQKHLSNLQPKVEEGVWTLGGALLSAPLTSPTDTAPQIQGSVMLASADTKEEVIELLKRDTYFTSGVWDWERVQIWPFKSMIRKEL